MGPIERRAAAPVSAGVAGDAPSVAAHLAGRAEARFAMIGRSVSGAAIDVRAFGEGPDVILFLASIHGDEDAGTPLLQRLADELEARPDLLAGRRVVLVPVANPDGRTSRRRTNGRGVDLNRNFPAENFDARGRHGAEPLCEPESRALHDLILREDPARVVSIHQPIACLDWDGPADDLAELMGRHAPDLPLKKLGSRPGSLGSWVGLELGRPIVTVELPRSADRLSAAKRWERWGPMLLAAVTFPDEPPPE